jgi:hypothetical protein
MDVGKAIELGIGGHHTEVWIARFEKMSGAIGELGSVARGSITEVDTPAADGAFGAVAAEEAEEVLRKIVLHLLTLVGLPPEDSEFKEAFRARLSMSDFHRTG